jgi:hypothetical protein
MLSLIIWKKCRERDKKKVGIGDREIGKGGL